MVYNLVLSLKWVSVHVINEIIINIIRLHRSTMYMWPIVADGVV